jgi:hypothetical protein
MKIKTVRRKPTYWREAYIYLAYEAACNGVESARGLAELWKVGVQTVLGWMRQHPAMVEAIKRGKQSRGVDANGDFKSFVYGRLPPELKDTWNRIIELDAEDTSNAEKLLEALTADLGKRARQQLWVYALISSNFNKNEACRRTNTSWGEVQTWAKHDPGFPAVLAAIQEGKKDFVEGSLFKLIASGDSPAIIFASKTLNRDRGYDSKQTVEVQHSGLVEHLHKPVSLDELDALPLEERKRILEGIRRSRSPKELPAAEIIIDNSSEDDS